MKIGNFHAGEHDSEEPCIFNHPSHSSCNAEIPYGFAWCCTRKSGHTGVHEASGWSKNSSNNRCLARWFDEGIEDDFQLHMFE